MLFHFSRNVFLHSQPDSLLSALCCHFTSSPSVFISLRCVEGRTINWVKGCWITAAASGASPYPVLHDCKCERLVILIGNSGSLACPVDGSLSRLWLQSPSSLCLTRQIWLFAFFFCSWHYFGMFLSYLHRFWRYLLSSAKFHSHLRVYFFRFVSVRKENALRLSVSWLSSQTRLA